MPDPQIIAVGGALLATETRGDALERYILDASGAAKPRVAFVPTASGEDPGYVARFHARYEPLGAKVDVLRFFRRTPDDLRAYLFAFDVVHVGGGNTRSMLAVWRHWGFDTILREAWERGIVLCGSSAGSICWFESGVTDSVAEELRAMDCLGFLAGSNCPHYDGEPERRPTYRRLVASGAIADGIACDDGAGVHYRRTEFAHAISALSNARAYRVERTADGFTETPLDALSLR